MFPLASLLALDTLRLLSSHLSFDPSELFYSHFVIGVSLWVKFSCKPSNKQKQTTALKIATSWFTRRLTSGWRRRKVSSSRFDYFVGHHEVRCVFVCVWEEEYPWQVLPLLQPLLLLTIFTRDFCAAMEQVRLSVVTSNKFTRCAFLLIKWSNTGSERALVSGKLKECVIHRSLLPRGWVHVGDKKEFFFFCTDTQGGSV